MIKNAIDRGEVITLLDRYYKGELKWNDMLAQLMELPPAGGMSAEEFLGLVQRRANVEGTPTYLQFAPGCQNPNFKIWIDQYAQWDLEHPVKKCPTRTQIFLRKFPHARLDTNGIPAACALDVFGGSLPPNTVDCDEDTCPKCWGVFVDE